MTPACTIDRLHLVLVATADAARASALMARLRELAERRVPAAIATVLDVDVDGDGIVFIDRLSFECVLNAAWDDDTLAQVLARHCVHAVHSQSEGAGARRFLDRAEFVASFLVALAGGSAESNWWFDEFDGLRLLPVSAALRTVLIGEGSAGCMALLRLTDEAARRVLQSLSGADARGVLRAFGGGAEHGLAVGYAELGAALDAPLAQALPDPAQRALAAWIALEHCAPGRASRAALDSLHRLALLGDAARGGALQAILAAETAPELALARCCAAVGIAPDFATGWSADDIAALVADLRGRAAGQPKAAAEAEAEPCAWGGAWLLIEQLLRLGWWQRWHAALHGEGCCGDAWLVLAVVARALAGDAYAVPAGDALLQRVLGATGEQRADRRRLRQALAPSDPWPGSHTYTTIVLGVGQRRRIALVEARHGLTVGLYRPARALEAIAAALPPDAVLLASPPSAAQADHADIGALHAWWQAHDPLRQPRGALERDLHVAALNLLREFAARLPGCADASAAYLRTQCLAMPALVTAGAARIDVCLGRAPLDVLLTLSGTKRSSTVLPDGRMLVIGPRAAP